MFTLGAKLLQVNFFYNTLNIRIMKLVDKLNKKQQRIMLEELEKQVEKGFQKFFTDEENRNLIWLRGNVKWRNFRNPLRISFDKIKEVVVMFQESGELKNSESLEILIELEEIKKKILRKVVDNTDHVL